MLVKKSKSKKKPKSPPKSPKRTASGRVRVRVVRPPPETGKGRGKVWRCVCGAVKSREARTCAACSQGDWLGDARQKIDPGDIFDLYMMGLRNSEIVRWLAEHRGLTVSRSRISQRVIALKEQLGDRLDYVMGVYVGPDKKSKSKSKS